MPTKNLYVCAFVAVALVVTVPAVAQQAKLGGISGDVTASRNVPPPEFAADPPLNAPEQWGISQWQTYTTTAFDAALRAGAWGDFNGAYIQSTSAADVSVGFPVHLPSGALAEYVRLFYNEGNVTDDVSAGFYRFSPYGTFASIVQMSPTPAVTGDTYVDFGPFSEVINNSPNGGYTYNILLITSGTTKIYKCTVWYYLQVAPAPATATFSDVPTDYWAFRHIEALAASGITAGCGGGNFCPENYVKRSEMAVYLAKALGLYWSY